MKYCPLPVFTLKPLLKNLYEKAILNCNFKIILLNTKLFYMNKLLYLLCFVLLCSFGSTDNKLSKKEKKYAIEYFKETQKDFLKEVKGLSEAQLNWKPADSVWSAAECIEHITLSEKNIFDWAISTLKEPANPAKRAELKQDDEGIKKMITNRSYKVKTTEAFKPSGQFGNSTEALKVFKERRSALIQYMKKSEDDLRNHFAQSPVGLMDTYQILIFLSGHTKRHTMQIAELKAMPGFPTS
jgi:DinB superfamily